MKTGVAIFIIHYQLLQAFKAYELPFFAEKQHNYRATLRSSPNYSRAFVCVFLHVGLHISYQCMKTSLGLIRTSRFGARALVMAASTAGEVQDVFIRRFECMGVKRLMCCAILGGIIKFI